MFRSVEDFVYGALLNDLAVEHHNDPIRHLGMTAMSCDKHDGHAEFRLKIFNQIQNLRLDRYIECRRRFIRNQSAG